MREQAQHLVAAVGEFRLRDDAVEEAAELRVQPVRAARTTAPAALAIT